MSGMVTGRMLVGEQWQNWMVGAWDDERIIIIQVRRERVEVMFGKDHSDIIVPPAKAKNEMEAHTVGQIRKSDSQGVDSFVTR